MRERAMVRRPTKSRRLVLVVLVRQVQPRLNSAALFFWDSPLRRIPLPSDILRRHAEMLCHRRLIRLPEPALTVPPLQYCLVRRQISVRRKILQCLGQPVQRGLHPRPWVGLRGARWPAQEQLTLPHSSGFCRLKNGRASKNDGDVANRCRPDQVGGGGAGFFGI